MNRTFWAHDGKGEYVAAFCECCRQEFAISELDNGLCERCEMDGEPDHRDTALDSQGYSF